MAAMQDLATEWGMPEAAVRALVREPFPALQLLLKVDAAATGELLWFCVTALLACYPTSQHTEVLLRFGVDASEKGRDSEASTTKALMLPRQFS